MPAVTVADILVLPRISEPDQATSQDRQVLSVTTAPSGFEGEGFPVRRAFAGVDLACARPLHPYGPDGRGRLRARRAQGHRLAPAPRLRDRHLHHRRHLPAPGLQRRRRADHQRRHAVDDRRRRHPAHRGAARGAGRERRPVPRLPALGEPAVEPKDGAAPVPGHPGWSGGPAQLSRRRRARAGHRRRGRRPSAAPASRTRRSRCVHVTVEPGAELRLPWRADFNALGLRAGGRGTVGPERRPVRTGQLAVFGPGDTLDLRRAADQNGPSDKLDILVLGGQPIGSRSPPTARSS